VASSSLVPEMLIGLAALVAVGTIVFLVVRVIQRNRP
jgi:hypothetical protein